jgi:hypothetical protein
MGEFHPEPAPERRLGVDNGLLIHGCIPGDETELIETFP